MNAPLAVLPIRLAAVTALSLGLAGCSSLGGLFGSDKVDYRSTPVKTQPLEVPPDLTQLARETRYQLPGGVISASGLAAAGATAAPAAAAAAAPATVALQSQQGLRIERDGQQRWLVVPMAPEALWPQLVAFWESRGFTLERADAAVGVMETNWAENRTQLPIGTVRNLLDRVLGKLYDTGERDRYRTRLERSDRGTEIYVSHSGMVEVYADDLRESTTWRGRPSDPQLEAEMLSQLLVALGGTELPQARAVVQAAPETPARARLIAGTTAALEMDDTFDRSWRRVGLALDRSGFTVEDRDRAVGLYFVRYVDPQAKGDPSFWSRLFGSSEPSTPQRYRIAVKADGATTVVAVMNSAGGTDTGESGQRIIERLLSELR